MGAKKLGTMKGKIKVSDDFDEPLKFEEDEKILEKHQTKMSEFVQKSIPKSYYKRTMHNAGLSQDFINETMHWFEFGGVSDLLKMWCQEEDAKEKEGILCDIVKLLNDCNRIYDSRSSRPNARTLEAFEQGKRGEVKTFNTIEEMLDELKNDDDDAYDDDETLNEAKQQLFERYDDFFNLRSKILHTVDKINLLQDINRKEEKEDIQEVAKRLRDKELEKAYTEQAKEEAKYNDDCFITIDISDSDLLILFKAAHRENISLNEFINEAIRKYLDNKLSDSLIKGMNTPHEECSTDLEDEEDINEDSEGLNTPERSWHETFDKIEPTGDFRPEEDDYDNILEEIRRTTDSLRKRLAQLIKDLDIEVDQNKWTPTPYQEKEIDNAVKWAETHKRKETDLDVAQQEWADAQEQKLQAFKLQERARMQKVRNENAKQKTKSELKEPK